MIAAVGLLNEPELELDLGNVRVIPHPLFSRGDMESQLERLTPPGFTFTAPQPGTRGPARLCGMNVLTSEQEQWLFLSMHWKLFQAAEASEPWQAEQREQLLRGAVEIRNRIVQANLRLVISIARTFLRAGYSLDDAFSDACPALIRAVELFDYTRGLCFSTYASHCVRNALNRASRKYDARTQREARFSDQVAHSILDESSPVRNPAEYLQQHQALAEELLRKLPEREQAVLRARFGLDDDQMKSFEQVGQLLGLSKERVRQLTHQALERLTQIVEEQGYEMPGE